MKNLIDQLKRTNAQTDYHRFGGIEFRFDTKEIAHIHGNGLLDIHFPVQLSKVLIEKGCCDEHHIFPGSGWISFRIERTTEPVRPMQLFKWSEELKKDMKTINEIEEEINQYVFYEE
ncbi:MAG: DUF5519 family protein [Bacteroidetes bacterium]|nr:DUF5519 family protein [Bacteroidota bacterium]